MLKKTKQISPPASARVKLSKTKENSGISPRNSQISSTSPKNSPKNLMKSPERRTSILSSQRVSRAKTLKVVFRRPSENFVMPQSIKVKEQNPNIQRNKSIDFEVSDPGNPMNLLGKLQIIYEETKKLIKKKQYKKGLISLLSFFWERNNDNNHFSLSNEIKINRMLVILILKILKRMYNKKNYQNIQRIYQIFEIFSSSISNWNKFLEVYLNKTCDSISKQNFFENKNDVKTENNDNDINENDALKTSSGTSIFKTKIGNKQKQVFFTTKTKNYIKKSLPQYFKYISILNGKDTAKLNENYEIDQFFYYFLTSIIYLVQVYKQEKNFRQAFWILHFGNELIKDINFVKNSDILNVSARIKLTLANLYFSFQKYEEALDIYDQLILFIENELSIRLHFRLFQNKRKDRLKLRKTLKILMISILNMAKIYLIQKRYHRTLESLHLHEIANFWLIPIDEVKRFISKSYNELQKKFDEYFESIFEMETLILEFLKMNITFNNNLILQEEIYNRNRSNNIDFQSKFNRRMSEKFDFLQPKMIIRSRQNSLPENVVPSCKSIESNENENQKLSFVSDNALKNSIFDLDSTKMLKSSDFTSFISLKSLKEQAKHKKKTDFLTKDHKPKIVTLPYYQNLFTNKKININTTITQRKRMENLDEFFSKKVNKNLEKDYENAPISEVKKNFHEYLIAEDFDKKEFTYCKKMLLMKENENLKDVQSNIPKKICTIPINRDIEEEAFFTQHKFIIEADSNWRIEKFRKLINETPQENLYLKRNFIEIISNVILNNPSIFNCPKLIRSLEKRKKEQNIEKEKNENKNNMQNSSFIRKPPSLKFFSSSIKTKTHSENLPLSNFFSNSQRFKTSSDSKLFKNKVRNSELRRSSVVLNLAELQLQEKKNMVTNKNNLSPKKIKFVDTSAVNGLMKDKLHNDLEEVKLKQKKIIEGEKIEKEGYKFRNNFGELANSLKNLNEKNKNN